MDKIKFKSENAEGENEFFFVAKRTMAIAANGDEFAGSVIAIHPDEQKITISFDDGSTGRWSCGATSENRLSK